MRFVGTCYRAHDPRWSFKPTSGEGAAIRGARFNPKGVPALYLGLSIMTAIKEISQGLPHRLDPTVLCSYDVDCEDVIDLTTERGRGLRRSRPARWPVTGHGLLPLVNGRLLGRFTIVWCHRALPALLCRAMPLELMLTIAIWCCGNGVRHFRI